MKRQMEHLLELLSYEESLRELELFSLEKGRLVLANRLTISLPFRIPTQQSEDAGFSIHTHPQNPPYSCQVTSGLSVLLRMRFPTSDS